MSSVVPSVKVAVAVNCCAPPTAKLAGEEGATAIEVTASTVKSTFGLVTPSKVAEKLADPAATPEAKPVEEIVAVAVVSLFQVTWLLMSAVVPSA